MVLLCVEFSEQIRLKYCFTKTKELQMKIIFNTLKLKIIKSCQQRFHTKLIIVADKMNLNGLLGVERYSHTSTVKKTKNIFQRKNLLVRHNNAKPEIFLNIKLPIER